MDNENFSNTSTCVFWDVDDYPIPKDIDIRCICYNFELALENLGYSVFYLEFEAYGENEIPQAESDELLDVGIMYNPKGSVNVMIWDVLLRANEPKNLIVISKKLHKDREAVRVLWALKSRGRNVLLVQPNDEAASEKLFHTPESISDCIIFLNGEKPIDQSVDDTSSCTSWETDTDTDGEIDDED